MGTLAVVLALGGASLGAGAASARTRGCGRFGLPPRAATMHQLRTSVLCLVNQARRRHGISPLRYNPELRRAATGLSRAMVASGSFSHYGPGGSTPTSRVSRAGYLAHAASFQLAENIGAGRGRADGSSMAIVRDWMHSPEHRANILNPGLRDFGVGVARGDPLGAGRNSATYTLDFGARRR